VKPPWVILLLVLAVPIRAADEGNLPDPLAAEEASGLPALAADEVEEILVGDRASSQPMYSPGPAVGFLRGRGADRDIWLAGGQPRLHFLRFLAVEGSPPFHESRVEHGDARAPQVPAQEGGRIAPLPGAPSCPCLGGGSYYSRITRGGEQSGLSYQTTPAFEAHAGAGLEIRPRTSTPIDAGLRGIFLPSGTRSIRPEDFDSGRAIAELNLFF